MTDDMKTIRPRAARMCGNTAWVTPICAVTLDRAVHDDAGVVHDAVQLGRETFRKTCERGSIGDLKWDRMYPVQAIETPEISVGPSGCVHVPASFAHVLGDRQADSTAGASDQYRRHRFSSNGTQRHVSYTFRIVAAPETYVNGL